MRWEILTKHWSENEVQRTLRKTKYRWENNIKKIGCKGMNWIHLVQDRAKWWALVNTGMNQRAPQRQDNWLAALILVSGGSMEVVTKTSKA
jgi:hypothetical protein